VIDLLPSLFQFSHTEATVFMLLLESQKPLSVNQIAEKTKLDVNTVSTAIPEVSNEEQIGL
jgi:predicted transcriptional regulator